MASAVISNMIVCNNITHKKPVYWKFIYEGVYTQTTPINFNKPYTLLSSANNQITGKGIQNHATCAPHLTCQTQPGRHAGMGARWASGRKVNKTRLPHE